jgi:hypothetical protein
MSSKEYGHGIDGEKATRRDKILVDCRGPQRWRDQELALEQLQALDALSSVARFFAH